MIVLDQMMQIGYNVSMVNDIQSLCSPMKITLILSTASGYLRASQESQTL